MKINSVKSITLKYKEGVLFTLFFLFWAATLSAQFYSTGQEPSSIRWKQIKTKNIRIVFPETNQSQALKYAALLNNNIEASSFGLNAPKSAITVWMHDHSVFANGMVAWAPARMEIYTVPPQDSYAQQWLPQLAAHEYRHVVQLHALDLGFTHSMNYVFGQQATGAVLGLFIPMWFMEGDAVANETALTKAGRGRQPSFEKYLRTQLLNFGSYSYAKAVFGSYRDFVPNRYQLGYYLVESGYLSQGADFWENVVENVARKPWQITPFSRGIKNGSGKNKWNWYEESIKHLQSNWQQKLIKQHFTIGRQRNVLAKRYLDVLYPVLLDNGEILAVISGLDRTDYFARIDLEGKVSKIIEMGYYLPDKVQVLPKGISWAAYRPDLRWANKDYSVIQSYDLEGNSRQKRTKKGRYFSPALSSKKNQWACILVDSLNQSHLLLIKDNEQSQVKTPTDLQLSQPCWSEDESAIFVLAIGTAGEAILAYQVSENKWDTIIPFGRTDLNHPYAAGEYLFFTASFTGVDNIFCYKLSDSAVYQLTSVPFAADYATLSNEKLVYSNYTAEGFRPAILDLDEALWRPLDKVSLTQFRRADSLSAQRPLKFQNDTVLHESYEIKNYSKIGHLFDFHSWGPISVDAGTYEVSPGFSVVSQNLLSTSFFSAGYEYDINETYGKWFVDYTYKGFYPELSFRAEYGQRERNVLTDNGIFKYKWNEWNLKAGIAQPLRLSGGNYARLLQPELHYTYSRFTDAGDTEIQYGLREYHIIDYRLYFSNIQRSVALDIYPRFGQVLDLNIRTLPFESPDGTMLSAESVLYFPGLWRHHGLSIYSGVQKRIKNGLIFSSIVNYPRGYSGKINEELLSLQATYRFPIAYPDWDIRGLLYLKRIKAGLFVDWAQGWNGAEGIQTYQSIGAELKTDFHFLELITPIEAGARMIYIPEAQDWRYEFSLSFDFVSLY